MPVMRITGAHEAAAAIGGLGVRVHAGIPPLVAHYGQLYQSRVRARASGRPGPRVQTGDYRRSIGLVMTTYQGAPAAIIGSSAPQARRLEYGFVGSDSLGRVYNQPPFPHFEPDIEKTAAEMEKAVERLLAGGSMAS